MSDSDKLDAPSKHLLSRLDPADTESQQQVGILMRGAGNFTDVELDALRADGAEIRTVAGDVLSANAAPSALADLARHDFVVSLELSQPLRSEGPDSGAQGSFYDVG